MYPMGNYGILGKKIASLGWNDLYPSCKCAGN